MLTHGSLLRSIKRTIGLHWSIWKMSLFRLPRRALRVHSPAIWALPQSKDFLPVHGGGFEPDKDSGSQDSDYKDDWLIIADSREKMMQNARVLAHITALGFRVNVRKSNFLHSFLGLELNSITIRLSKECILSFVNCLSQFREGARVQYRTCLRLQGLMAAAIQTWCNWMLLQRSGVDALPIGESLHSMFQRTGVTTVNYCFLPNVPALALMDLFCVWSLTIICFFCLERPLTLIYI